MTLPNFVLIGAAKSGTSSLHHYLRQHPDIFLGSPKEPNFLAFEGGVPAFRGPADDPWRSSAARYQLSITTLSDYERLFEGVRGESAIGESSVVTMAVPQAIDRIERYLPDARLIALLRHPADRAFSRFVQMRNEGLEPHTTFREALRAEAGRARRNWSPTWLYAGRGFYHAQLRPFLERFGRDRLCIQIYDDFARDPLSVVQAVYRFLDVDDRFVPDTGRRLMAAAATVVQPRNRLVDSLLNYPNPFKSTFNRLLPARSLRQPLRRLLLRLNRGQPEKRTKPVLPDEVRAELTALFRDDILALQKLVDRDLSHWLM